MKYCSYYNTLFGNLYRLFLVLNNNHLKECFPWNNFSFWKHVLHHRRLLYQDLIHNHRSVDLCRIFASQPRDSSYQYILDMIERKENNVILISNNEKKFCELYISMIQIRFYTRIPCLHNLCPILTTVPENNSFSRSCGEGVLMKPKYNRHLFPIFAQCEQPLGC